MNNTKEVNYLEYCPKCKHYKKLDYEEPCNECLTQSFMIDSHKPLHFESRFILKRNGEKR